MERRKVNLPQTKWGTIKSKYQPESNYLSNDEFTRGSSNFLTNVTGAIEKRPKDTLYSATPLSAPGKDAYEAIFSNGTHHLLFMDSGTLKYTSGDNIVHTVTSGFTANGSMEYAMYQNRVYMGNGVDAPRVYDLTSSYGGVSYTPPQVKLMGAQPPVAAVTFGADTSGGSVPAGGHTYKVTFLYYGFEESNGGPASALHTVTNPNNTVHLTAVPVGGYGVTARKIYRDNNDGNYLLVGTISDNTTTIFTDTISAGTTAIPTSNNTPPTFSYIVLNLSRLFVAGVSGTPTSLYWSSPGLPDIFDPNNTLICNPKDAIQALAVYQGTVYVLNRHSFGQILGNTDDTFYYQEFPGTVGCTDNRSIQVRTINGVPVLVWLSDRGFYAFNGSSVEYISDPIEDEVNLNIQQTSFATGSNTQSTQADFQAGTYTGGIDLNSSPGSVTTFNPIRTWDDQADWEGGSTQSNLNTVDGSNTIKVPTRFAPVLTNGTLTPEAIIVGTNVTLPFYNGEDKTADASYTGLTQINDSGAGTFGRQAQPFIPTKSGTITTIKLHVHVNAATPAWKFKMQFYSGNAQPTTLLFSSAVISPPLGDSVQSQTVSIAVTAGTKYWIAATALVADGIPVAPSTINVMQIRTKAAAEFSVNPAFIFSNNTGTWNSQTNTTVAAGYVLQYSQSGQYLSEIYDTLSNNVSPTLHLDNTGSFPSGTSAVTTVEGSNSPTFLFGAEVSQAINNQTTGQDLSISGKRYWRIRIAVSSTDSNNVPLVGTPVLKFNQTGTWISEVIDATADVTDFTNLDLVYSTPVGTSVVFTVATSANNISYPDGFVPFGTEVTRRYIKVKAVLSTDTGNIVTPSITSIVLKWSLASTFESSVIDTALAPPSGWGIFQFVSALNGGTLTVQMRSGATLVALAAATYYTVTNGNFPPVNVVPLQYTQWRLLFTSTANQVPTVDSVTVNWFLGSNTAPIRVASLFFNKTYYLAAAETGFTYNNVVLIWDQEGNWRIWRDVNINSLSLFFNQPFYLDAVRPNIYQWLIALDGTGTPITMDVRTKAFDLLDYDHLKNPRSLRVMGLNTGTTIHAYFSVDRGSTWIEMLNSHGLMGYTTSTDGNKFYEYFVPNYDLGQMVAGVTIMFRVTSTDAFPTEILALEPEITIRAGKYLGYAT